MPKLLNLKILDPNSKLWNFYLPILFIGIGVAIRCWTYLQNQCLWQDEGNWVVQIVGWSWKDILINKITIPLGLAAAIKSLVLFIGGYEYVWRLIPFLCSIGALLAYDYFLRLVASPFVRCLALALLAFLSLPVYYASELRAYSVDMFGLLTLFCALIKVLENPSSISRGFLLLAAGLLLPWFSYAPLFILPAIMCVFLLDLSRSQKKFPPALCHSAIFIWGINLICLYFLFYKHMDDSKIYKGQLQDGFPPYPFSWQSLMWLFERSKDFLNSTGFEWPLLALMFTAFGFFHLFKTAYVHTDGDANTSRRQFFFKLSCGIVFWVLLTAALHKYPLMPRLQLFLVPLLLWFIAEGVHVVFIQKSRWVKICALLLAITLCISSACRTWHDQLWMKPDMRSAMELMNKEQKPGDRILLVEASQYAYSYYYFFYTYYLSLDYLASISTVLQDPNGRKYINYWVYNSHLGKLYENGVFQWITDDRNDQQNFKKLLPPGRLWVLFSDSGDKSFFLNQLNQNGKKTGQWNYHRVDLYLYEFSKD